MNIETFGICCLVFLLLFIVMLFSFYLLEYKKRQSYVINFESYITVFEYYLQKSFDMIYKDRIMIYSIEATKLNDKQFITVSKDFGTLVIKMLGPNLVKEYITLFGNEQTFLFNISEYFNTKFEEDEIRKDSIDKLMNSDIEDEKVI